MRQKGLTLVEFLVALSIVGLIGALAFTIAPSSVSKAKQAHCKENLRKIYIAMELYKSDNQNYQRIHPDVDVPILPTKFLVSDPTYVKSKELLYCPTCPNCAKEKLASTYRFTTPPPSGSPLYATASAQLKQWFKNPEYPIIHCMVHDEIEYFPKERHLAAEFNPPFVIWVTQTGAVKSGRFQITRGHDIARNCALE